MKKALLKILSCVVAILYIFSCMGYGVHKCSCSGVSNLILLFGESPCEYIHPDHAREHNMHCHCAEHNVAQSAEHCCCGNHLAENSNESSVFHNIIDGTETGCCCNSNSNCGNNEGVCSSECNNCCSTSVFVLTDERVSTSACKMVDLSFGWAISIAHNIAILPGEAHHSAFCQHTAGEQIIHSKLLLNKNCSYRI